MPLIFFYDLFGSTLLARSLLELASCSNMSALYKHAFDEVACTDSSRMFTMISTISFAMTFVGMIMVMLRAGMYPFAKVYYTQAVASLESEKQTPNPSAPPETPSFHKHNPSTKDKLSPPDAKFLAIWGGDTEASAMNPHCIDPNEEAPHPSAQPETPSFHKATQNEPIWGGRTNQLDTVDLSSLSSNDFAPDEGDQSPLTPRKLW
jgi:hypothetical protein